MNSLKVFGIDFCCIKSSKYDLLSFKDKNIVINLISLHNDYDPVDLIALQSQYQSDNIYLVHLWEDIWQTRSSQVTGRIASILGLNERIHARKTEVISITQKQADEFLTEHHLQASATFKYKFALTFNHQIMAVAGFSGLRPMRRIADDYNSAEVIRFANRVGFTVTGGFSKLLKHFINHVGPNDIMSYADRDWSLGRAYEQSGFKLISVTPPSEIWLSRKALLRYFPHRIPVEPENIGMSILKDKNDKYIKVFNTGNLKYILYL